MILETKFDTGDIVHFYNDHMVPTKGSVTAITVTRTLGRAGNVTQEEDYTIKVRGDRYPHHHDVKDLFSIPVPPVR